MRLEMYKLNTCGYVIHPNFLSEEALIATHSFHCLPPSDIQHDALQKNMPFHRWDNEKYSCLSLAHIGELL